MQTIYGWEMDHDVPLLKLEGQLNGQIQKSVALYLTDLLYLVDVCLYCRIDKERRETKYIKTEEDYNVSTALASNAIIQFLQNDPVFNAQIKKDGIKNYVTEEIVKTLFTELTGKPKYKEYSSLSEPGLARDKEVINIILKKIFQSNKALEHHLEEIFINYDDDNALLLHIISKYCESI